MLMKSSGINYVLNMKHENDGHFSQYVVPSDSTNSSSFLQALWIIQYFLIPIRSLSG